MYSNYSESNKRRKTDNSNIKLIKVEEDREGLIFNIIYDNVPFNLRWEELSAEQQLIVIKETVCTKSLWTEKVRESCLKN